MLALSIFPGSHPPSIVDALELNFCVRNGNRWTLAVINTNCKRHYITPFTLCQVFFSLGDPGGNRTHVNGVRGRCLNRLTTGPHRELSEQLLLLITGAPSRTRTGDPLIKSQLLYQLS